MPHEELTPQEKRIVSLLSRERAERLHEELSRRLGFGTRRDGRVYRRRLLTERQALFASPREVARALGLDVVEGRQLTQAQMVHVQREYLRLERKFRGR